MEKNTRFQPRYFCSLDDPEAIRTWFLIDRQTGVPLMADGGIRYFTRGELDTFLSKQDDEGKQTGRID